MIFRRTMVNRSKAKRSEQAALQRDRRSASTSRLDQGARNLSFRLVSRGTVEAAGYGKPLQAMRSVSAETRDERTSPTLPKKKNALQKAVQSLKSFRIG